MFFFLCLHFLFFLRILSFSRRYLALLFFVWVILLPVNIAHFVQFTLFVYTN